MQKGIQYNSVRALNIYITAVKTRENDTTDYRVQLGKLTPAAFDNYSYL